MHLGSALQPKPLDENEKAEETAAENTAELGEVTVVRESQSRAAFAAAAVPATSASHLSWMPGGALQRIEYSDWVYDRFVEIGLCVQNVTRLQRRMEHGHAE